MSFLLVLCSPALGYFMHHEIPGSGGVGDGTLTVSEDVYRIGDPDLSLRPRDSVTGCKHQISPGFTCASCATDLLSPRLAQESGRGSSGWKTPKTNTGSLPSRVGMCTEGSSSSFRDDGKRMCSATLGRRRAAFWEASVHICSNLENGRQEIMVCSR